MSLSGRPRGAASSPQAARSVCYAVVGVWALLLAGALSLVFSFTRALRARASEHGLGGGLRSLTLAEADRGGGCRCCCFL
jgi:hypothetical protein